MNIKQVKYELQNILSGKSSQSYDSTIQAVTSYLRESKGSSTLVKHQFKNKAEETKELLNYAENTQLIFKNIKEENYVSEGAEQKVFIKNKDYVLKLNDAIYYTSWLDYFYNLLLGT